MLHLRVQRRITNQLRRVLHLATSLIQPRNGPHDSPLHDIGKVRDAVERHASRPFVDNLCQSEPRLAGEVVAVFAGLDDLVLDLEVVDFFGDADDGFFAFLQAGG